MNINGLTSKEWKEFEDLLIKSNNIQLAEMKRQIVKEKIRRSEINGETKTKNLANRN
jgi:hypothetical protein